MKGTNLIGVFLFHGDNYILTVFLNKVKVKVKVTPTTGRKGPRGFRAGF
jgi:hypothetical protein